MNLGSKAPAMPTCCFQPTEPRLHDRHSELVPATSIATRAQAPAGGCHRSCRDLPVAAVAAGPMGRVNGRSCFASHALAETHRRQSISKPAGPTPRRNQCLPGSNASLKISHQPIRAVQLGHSGASTSAPPQPSYCARSNPWGSSVLSNSAPIGVPKLYAPSNLPLDLANGSQPRLD